FQECQQGRECLLECRVEREDLASHFGPHGPCIVTLLHRGIMSEQVEDREVWGGFAIRHGGALQYPPVLEVVRVDNFIDQARLPYARLPGQRDHLALSCVSPSQGLDEGCKLGVSADKACK